MTLLKFTYSILKRTGNFLGYNLLIRKKAKESKDYEGILPIANYAPWKSDTSFNKAYDIAKKYTLVDKYRCYELWQLVKECAMLEGALIEVGVWRGGSGALIAKQASLNGIDDTVYLCDTFTGVVKAGEKDSKYRGGEHADTSKEIAVEVITKLKLENTKILVGIFPEDTSDQITSNKFRFCHIDVDVYQSAKDIVDWLWPKLVEGGMVVFDDYGFEGGDGITKFVNEQREKIDRRVIYNLNGHAIIIKLK